MEILRGKHPSFIDAAHLHDRMRAYHTVHIDLGTGDGRFVCQLAKAQPDSFVIGVDASRENLIKSSRTAPNNALFVIADAQNMPNELDQLASHITINFPWGSLMAGLLSPGSGVLQGLSRIARPDAQLAIHLNGGALTELGWNFDAGTTYVMESLRDCGFAMKKPIRLASQDLKQIPSTWAKRLAFGRDPRGVCLEGRRIAFIEDAVRKHTA